MKISLASVSAFVLILAMAQVSAKSSRWSIPSSWSDSLQNVQDAFQSAENRMSKDLKAAGRSIRHGAKDTKSYLASVLGLSKPSSTDSSSTSTAATAAPSSSSVFVIPPAPATSSESSITSAATSAAASSSIASIASVAPSVASASASVTTSSSAAIVSAQPSSTSSSSSSTTSSTFQATPNAIPPVSSSSAKAFFAGKSRRCLIPVSAGSIASATLNASHPNQMDSSSAAATTSVVGAPWDSYFNNKSSDKVTETLLSTVTATLVLPSNASINPMEFVTIREKERFNSTYSTDPFGSSGKIKDYATSNDKSKYWWLTGQSPSKSLGLWDRILGYGSSSKRNNVASSDKNALKKSDSSKSLFARMMASFDSSKLSAGDRAKMFDFWHYFHRHGNAPSSTSDFKSSEQPSATSTQELVFVTGTAQDGNPMVAGSAKVELPFCGRSKKN